MYRDRHFGESWGRVAINKNRPNLQARLYWDGTWATLSLCAPSPGPDPCTVLSSAALLCPCTLELLPCWVESLDSYLVLTHQMHFLVFFFEANSPCQPCILGELGKENHDHQGSTSVILGHVLLSDMLAYGSIFYIDNSYDISKNRLKTDLIALWLIYSELDGLEKQATTLWDASFSQQCSARRLDGVAYWSGATKSHWYSLPHLEQVFHGAGKPARL